MNSAQPTESTRAKSLKIRILDTLMGAVSHLPIPLMLGIGVVIGEILFWLFGSRRRITETNISLCFPGKSRGQVRRMARQHFHQMATSLLTLTLAWWGSRRQLQDACSVRDPETLALLESQSQPIILLAPHFTSLEVLGNFISSRMPASTMYQTHKNPGLDQWIIDRRSRHDGLLFDSRSAGTALVRSIREGRPFYYLPDQDPGRRRAVFAPFYGIPTATFPALGKIAKLSRASVIPAMAFLKPGGRGFEIVFGEPLTDFPCGDPVEDSTTMNAAIERLIENAPAQYYWSHKRFKTRPEGDPSFYD